jgi:hypothetical protein
MADEELARHLEKVRRLAAIADRIQIVASAAPLTAELENVGQEWVLRIDPQTRAALTRELEEWVSVVVVREDLRLLLVAATIHQMDTESSEGRRDPRLQLAIDRIGATASSAEWQPKKLADPEDDPER